jgi:hypothetical protein
MTTINTDEIATMDVLPVIVDRSEAPDIVIGPILHGENLVDAELQYSWFLVSVLTKGATRIMVLWQLVRQTSENLPRLADRATKKTGLQSS